jgi:cob(I)alamin adenosyltransferase
LNRFKIYTKTGDDGTTGLVGGNRIKKYNVRLDAYGTIDELNSWLGVIRSYQTEHQIIPLLKEIQNKLFIIGSKLASDEKGRLITDKLKITNEDINVLETAIDNFESDLPELTGFILPGGIPVSGFCHVARTVCRRAERRIVQLSESEEVEGVIIQYINRLSDFLFVLSRKLSWEQNYPDLYWEHD